MSERNTIAIQTSLVTDGDTRFVVDALDDGKFLDVLQERELSAVVVSKASYGENGTWFTALPGLGGVALESVRSKPEDIQATYSRVVLPHTYVDDLGIPQLNPTAIKQFGKDKANTIGILGEFEIPTQIVKSDDMSDLFIGESGELILKPVDGRLGRGFQKFDSSELSKRLVQAFAGDGGGELLLQPYLGTGKVPEGIRGISQTDQEVLNSVKQHGTPAELRIFVVKNGERHVTIPVMRIAAKGTQHLEGNDTYLDIELNDELETLLLPDATSIVDDACSRSENAQNVLAVVDYLFDGDRFWAMEANFRSPTLPLTRENPHAARSIYPAVADTLYVMSEGGK